jgi:hypothetical protein
VGSGEFCSFFDLFIGCIQTTVTNIFPNGAGKQVRSLQDDADPRLDGMLREFGVIPSSNTDLAAAWFEKRQIKLTMVDLPPPVGPTSAIVSPCLTLIEKSFRTGFSSS